MGNYLFRQIKKEEIPQMFSIIKERMKWMDENGIRQWNVTFYDTVYPESYYEDFRQKGMVYVLEDGSTGKIVCAAVLKDEDDRWVSPKGSALYLHNFASKVGTKGFGEMFLKCAETLARQKGADYFRLDSPSGSTNLSRYYEQKGYEAVGKCVD